MTATTTPDGTQTRIMLRPIGHSLPLGFLGLAAATVVVAGVQLGWFPAAETPNIAWILIAFVFPTQLISSVFGYLARDTAAGTGMGVLAGTWLSVGLVLQHGQPGATSKALGLFLFMAGISMLIPAAGAFSGKVVPALVLTGAALRFLVTGAYEWSGTEGWKTAAGVVGVALGVLAVYAALAIALEDILDKQILPTLRHDAGRLATTGTMRDQLRDVAHDPGVRQQL